jgi:hypothetical protein
VNNGASTVAQHNVLRTKGLCNGAQRTGHLWSNAGAWLSFTKSAEGNGIAKSLDGGNAVLEVPTGGASHYIYGAGLEDDGDKLAFGAVGLESHAAGRGERDSDNDLELRNIAVPADGSAGRIFGDDNFDEGFGRKIGEGSGAVAKRNEEFGQRLGGGGGSRCEVVFPSIFDNASFSCVSLEFEGMEVELADGGEEVGQFGFGEE